MQAISLFDDSPSNFLHLLLLHFRQIVHLILQQLILKGKIAVFLRIDIEQIDLPALGAALPCEQLWYFCLIPSKSGCVGYI